MTLERLPNATETRVASAIVLFAEAGYALRRGNRAIAGLLAGAAVLAYRFTAVGILAEIAIRGYRFAR